MFTFTAAQTWTLICILLVFDVFIVRNTLQIRKERKKLEEQTKRRKAERGG